MLERQPINQDVLKQIEAELMAPVEPYRHARVERPVPSYTEIEKRPRKVARK